MRSSVLSCALWLSCVGLAWSQPASSPAVKVVAHTDRSTVGLGRTVVLTLDVSYPTGVNVALPRPESLRFPSFDVKEAAETNLPASQGRHLARYTVRMAAYNDGPHKVEPVRIDYRNQDGSGGTAQSEPLSLEVERVAAVPAGKTNTDVRDLKPMDPIAGPWWMALLSKGGLFVLVTLVGLVPIAFLRSLKRKPKRPRTPYEIAVQALELLGSENLPGRGQNRLHYERLSEALRSYLARRYELPVLEHTTDEVVAMLDAEGLDPTVCERLRPILDESDLVKFARLRVAPDRALSQLRVARDIVEITRPIEIPVQGGLK